MEPVFRTLEIAAKALVTATGTKDHLPAHRAHPGDRRRGDRDQPHQLRGLATCRARCPGSRAALRYMIKAEMQQVKVVNFLIKHTKTIPVDRRSGARAYAEAVRLLRAGELVGLMPEATISRSFELKDFKTGAARMALEAGVPTVPLIVWGAQRIWTKDHPRNVGYKKIPVSRGGGPAVAASRRPRASGRRSARGNDVVAAPRSRGVSASRGCFLGAAAVGRQRTYGSGGKNY
jgi:1-acyl-sn-glycerol-3-phosphate acyltransferase